MRTLEAKEAIEPWFKKTEHEILDEFESLEGAFSIGSGDYRSVIVPGTRDTNNSVVLVAHADTVWQDTPHLEVEYIDGLFVSAKRVRCLSEKKKSPIIGGYGIGADDRAGIAALWNLKDLGHTLIITNNEECGCLSSSLLAANDEVMTFIGEHNFAIELDREGRNDLVFYNVSTEEFRNWCQDQTGYKTATGSSSDISILCRDICGLNVSIGYRNQHTPNEILNVKWWCRTYNMMKQWLSSNERTSTKFTL